MFCRLLLLFVAVLLFTDTRGQALFVEPHLVPVDRLLKRGEAFLLKHPKDAQAHYTLARIHYLAFSMKRDRVPVAMREDLEPEGDILRLAPDWMRDMEKGSVEGAVLSTQQTIDHASKALDLFNAVILLAPKDGLYALGRASLLEEFWRWNRAYKPREVPAELQGMTIEGIRAAYAKAFTLAMVEDSKMQNRPAEGMRGIVAYEAGARLIGLEEEYPENLSADDKQSVKSAREALTRFRQLPRGDITPIVFSFRPSAHLDELLEPTRIVDFDLRGYGPRERWPWVKPELGFLVWDPLETGCIQSARQMFGSYTFQIFRRTGYDALAALDDDADGALTGAELAGLSVWFDRDGDGRSTTAEVTPLRMLGVESIAATATSRDGLHPMNPRGLTLRGGRTLPTWDWIVKPAL